VGITSARRSESALFSDHPHARGDYERPE